MVQLSIIIYFSLLWLYIIKLLWFIKKQLRTVIILLTFTSKAKLELTEKEINKNFKRGYEEQKSDLQKD